MASINNNPSWLLRTLPSDLELVIPAPRPLRIGSEPRFTAQVVTGSQTPITAASLLFIDGDEKKEEEKASISSSRDLSGKTETTTAKPAFKPEINNEWLKLAHNPAPADQITWSSHLEMAEAALFFSATKSERESCHTILPYTPFEIKAKSTLLSSANHTYLHAPIDVIKNSLEIYREKYRDRRNQVAELIRSICHQIACETFNRQQLDVYIDTLQTMLKEMGTDLERVELRAGEVANQYLATGPRNVFNQQRKSGEQTITIPNFFDPGAPHSFSREDGSEGKIKVIEEFYTAYSAILDECKDYIGKCIARTQELTHYLENGRRFYPQN